MTRATDGVRQVVLERDYVPGLTTTHAAYSRPGGTGTDRMPKVCLSPADFRALGEPERITVTIRNRDVGEPLNEQYVAGLAFAAEMVHAETRWQTERQMSGHTDAGPIADRMTEVEKALRTVMRTIEPGDRRTEEADRG